MENYGPRHYLTYNPDSNFGEKRTKEKNCEGIRIQREPLENYQYALVGEIKELKLEI